LSYGYSCKVSSARPGYAVICNFLTSGHSDDVNVKDVVAAAGGRHDNKPVKQSTLQSLHSTNSHTDAASDVSILWRCCELSR